MKSIITICSMLLITITAAPLNTIEDPDSLSVKCTELNFEKCAIINMNAFKDDEPVNIDELFVFKIEEEVNIGFDTKQFLPEGFNPLKGIGDLDWASIELVELEEEVTIDFDTEKFLPEGFNPLKGLGDLDWTAIELVELEEEVTIPFDTKQFLPEDFNPLNGLGDLDWSKIELIEIEEEVEIDYDTKLYLPRNFNAYKPFAGI